MLEDIDQQGVEEIYCLGDVVGYGPNPRECIDEMIERANICLLGNHDQGALFDPEGFNLTAENAIFWTREQLEEFGGSNGQRRWDFLGERPRLHREDDFLYVHGSARNPLNEYVFPEDIVDERKMDRLFSVIPKYAFQGHTHVPGVFTESEHDFFSPDEIDDQYTLAEGKVMINVGSVGQPRDQDPRASYVLLEDNLVTFRRVEYPVNQTVEKIYQVEDLDNFLGDRLFTGR